MSGVAPSGAQFQIRHGDQLATIVEVGGGVRAFEVEDRPVLDPYPLDSMCEAAHGAPLMPWPNRLADGRYRFDGVDHRVALTEPERGNAIHGFLRWRSWMAGERDTSRVVMQTRLYPLDGYPFALDVRIAYELSDAGLSVSTSATNIGQRTCPFGAGQHPYLSGGGGLIDDCVLQLPADTMIAVDEQRKLPTGREPVDGSTFDFRLPRRLGDQQMDLTFTGLTRDDDGRARTTLSAPDGSRVELWSDDRYPYIELYTGDALRPPARRRGLAVEPMTCPPNAFQSGDGLVTLGPGETFTAAWGVRLV